MDEKHLGVLQLQVQWRPTLLFKIICNEFNGSRSSNNGSAEKNSNFQIADQNSLADSIPSEEYIPIEESDNEALSLKDQDLKK